MNILNKEQRMFLERYLTYIEYVEKLGDYQNHHMVQLTTIKEGKERNTIFNLSNIKGIRNTISNILKDGYYTDLHKGTIDSIPFRRYFERLHEYLGKQYINITFNMID